jgi:hypothetical protein
VFRDITLVGGDIDESGFGSSWGQNDDPDTPSSGDESSEQTNIKLLPLKGGRAGYSITATRGRVGRFDHARGTGLGTWGSHSVFNAHDFPFLRGRARDRTTINLPKIVLDHFQSLQNHGH